MAIKYIFPESWLKYDPIAIVAELTDAKAAVISLTNVPFQKAWAEKLQQIQLKSEVAGTSRIEGAEFTERELDAALLGRTPEKLLTRSQKQAKAAMFTYRWISSLLNNRPIDASLIKEVHRRLVTGCDDDHCQPAALRGDGYNVVFGTPQHRGAEGGKECEHAFSGLSEALRREFRDHDLLVQALALHYHLGAIHPFQDGNGRTARAVEALMLQRAGLKDALFIALSNYYYDEKLQYLAALSEARTRGHDLTPFLKFGLRGIALQCRRLLNEINLQIKRALFRDLANDLFGRLQHKKKRVIAERQMAILNSLLERSTLSVPDLYTELQPIYVKLKAPERAYWRDIFELQKLQAIEVYSELIIGEGEQYDDQGEYRYADAETRGQESKILVSLRLEWPTEITETEFFKRIAEMPKAKTLSFLQKPGRSR